MSFLLVANFKSHQGVEDSRAWLEEVKPSREDTELQVVVAPSALHLHLFKSKDFSLASQDSSPFPPGSYTGAINARQLKEYGVTYAIIGHSERRQYFHETANEVANKAKELTENGIIPIVCLREADILPQRAAFDDELAKKCLFCYEPEGGIGGTETAATSDIQTTITKIKDVFGVEAALYGGSVTADNIESLLPLNLAGVLVASASLDSQSFNRILAAIKHAD